MENILSRVSLIKFLSFSIYLLASTVVLAGPTGETVVSGDITVSRPSSTTTQVNQTTNKGIIHWQDFSIGQGEAVHFQQPGASSLTLNRVTGTNPSSILGQLTANGQIILINRAGVLFGANARVDVAGLIATTANITNQDFNAGRYQFQQEGQTAGQILQQGTIQAREGGAVVLVAPNVTNEGLIGAKAGKIALGSGSAYTVDLAGDQLLQFAVDPTQMSAVNAKGEAVPVGVHQAGQVFSEGGSVLLSTQAAHKSINQVISHTGITEAKTLVNKNGQIILSGGAETEVQVSGQLAATGEQAGQKGGTIKILAPKISVGTTAPATLNVSGKAGGGTILVGGNSQGKGLEPNAQQVTVGNQATLQANATDNGNGGKVVAYSTNATGFHGAAEAKGGPNGGNGGMIETSGPQLDVKGAKIDAGASKGQPGTWLLDPTDMVIDAEMAAQYSMALKSTNVTIQTSGVGEDPGDIILDKNILLEWNAGTFLTLLAHRYIHFGEGSSVQKTGDNGGVILKADAYGQNNEGTIRFYDSTPQVIVNGQNNSVLFYHNSIIYPKPEDFQDHVSVSGAGSQFIPYMWVHDFDMLQGMENPWGAYALSKNINAGDHFFMPIGTDASPFTGHFDGNGYEIQDLTIDLPESSYVGLFGYVDGGSISNLSLTSSGKGGMVVGGTWVGSVAGYANNAVLSNVTSHLSIQGTSQYIGGLVGLLNGGAIINSSNTGTVSGFSSSQYIGGLVGLLNVGTIVNSSNSGTVSGGQMSSEIGGLVGMMDLGAYVINSSNTGEVSGLNMHIGGIAGLMDNGSHIWSSYNTAPVSGVIESSWLVGGLVGEGNANGELPEIKDSYNTGAIQGGYYLGGIAGAFRGSISNAYNQGSVSGSSAGVGGVVGEQVLGTIDYVYNTGHVSGSDNVGGLVGNQTGGTLSSNSFFNTDTSGTAYAIGSSGSTAGSLNTAQMKNAANYTGWDFSNTWGNIEDISYPFLNFQYGGASNVRYIWGTATDGNGSALSSLPVKLNINGVELSDSLMTDPTNTVHPGVFYYIFNKEAPGTGLTWNSTGNNAVKGYVDNRDNKANTSYQQNTGGSIANFNLTTNTVRSISGGTLSGSIADFVNWAIPAEKSLFSASEDELILNSGVNFIADSSASSPFQLAGNITASGSGSIMFNGPTILTGASQLTGPTVTFGNSLNGAYALGITGNAAFQGVVGGSTSLASLSVTGATDIGANITTSGTQNYQGALNLLSDVALTSTGGNIQFPNAIINAPTRSLTLSAAGNITPVPTTLKSFILSRGTWNQIQATLPTFSVSDNFAINSSSATFKRFTGGDGTSGNPFELVDVYGLQGMDSQSLFGSSFELVRDIDASSTGTWNNGTGFSPIGGGVYSGGVYTLPFAGTLEGNRHSITGLIINRVSPSEYNQGLFSYLTGAVRNLGIQASIKNLQSNYAGIVAGMTGPGAQISGVHTSGELQSIGGYVGGLVGNARYVTITNSYNEAQINGNTRVGGLVGELSSGASINNSYNKGYICSSSEMVGGLAGSITNGKINHSYNTGEVRGAGFYAGGLAGHISGGPETITQSYNTGKVAGYNYVGGLAGEMVSGQASITQSYNVGLVTGLDSNMGGLVGRISAGSVSSSFWDTETSHMAWGDYGRIIDRSIYGKNTAEMKDPATFKGAGWSAFPASSSGPWYLELGSYPSFIWSLFTYNITNPLQLQLMSYDLAGHYQLMNNINASVTSTWNGGAGFVPIGTSSANPFTGTIEGNNYSIQDLYINSPSSDYVGLIGYMNGGSISNLSLTRSGGTGSIVGRDYVGGFVGYANNATLTNLKNALAVTGMRESSGGIAGYLSGGTLVDSYNTGAISGAHSSGGLIGTVYGGAVTTSYNEGAVSGSDNVGGLVGLLMNSANSSASLTNAYNKGAVSGNTNVGGVVGYEQSGSLAQLYNIGLVTGTTPSSLGGLVGYVQGGTVNNSYWNISVPNTPQVGAGNVAIGTPRTTSQMKTQAGMSGFNFTNTWGNVDSISYPYLRWQLGGGTNVGYIAGHLFDAGSSSLPIQLYVNGSAVPISSSLISDPADSGAFYYLFDKNSNTLPFTWSSSGNTIRGYTVDATNMANTVYQQNTDASVSNFNMSINAVRDISVGTPGSLADFNWVPAYSLFTYNPGTSTLTLNNSANFIADGSFNLAGSIVPSSGVGGNITFNGPTILLGTSQLTANTTTFANTLNGGYGLEIGGNATFQGIVGGIASLSVSGTSGLSGNVTTTGNQSYTGQMTLNGGPITLDAGSGNINIAGGIIGGSQALTLNSTGTTTLGGTINNLSSLITNVGGTTRINAANITTSGAQTYSDAIILGNDVTLASTANGAINIGAGVSGANNLTINTGGTTSLAGTISGLTSLTTNVGGTTQINTSNITTSGAQTYSDAIILGNDVTLASTGNGNISIGAGVSGANSLAINTSGITSLAGTIAGLTSLTTNAGGTTQINTSGITTTAAQTYNDAVILGLLGTSTLSGSTIKFGDVLNAAGATGYNLNVAGNAFFQNMVGASTPLSSLSVSGTSGVFGNITTSGNQSYTGLMTLIGAPINLGAGSGNINIAGGVAGGSQALTLNSTGTTTLAGTISGLLSLTTSVGGTTQINTANITTSGAQTYYGDVNLLNASTTLTGSDIILAGLLNGASALTVANSGKAAFQKAVGGTTALTSLTVNGAADIGTLTTAGNIKTSGAQTYTGTATLLGNTNLTGTSLTYSGITGSGKDLTLDFTNAVDVGSAISGVHNLNVAKQSNLNGTITTSGTQTYTGTATLVGNTNLTGTGLTYSGITGSGKDLTLDFTNAVNIGSGIAGVQNLIVNKDAILSGNIATGGTQTYAGTATLAGNTSLTGTGLTYSGITGNGKDLALDFTNAVDVGSAISGVRNLSIAKQSSLNGAITTSGMQTYTGTATLAGNTSLTGTGLTYSGITGSGKDLALDFTNAVDVGSAISGVHNLNVAKQSNLNGAITTTGTQTYTGTATLLGDTNLTGTGLTYSGITGSGKDLTLDFTNAVNVGSAISGVRNLNVVKQSNLNGAINTTGTQTYAGAATLVGNTNLTGTGLTYSGITGTGQDLVLDFTNAVDVGSAISGVRNLNINNQSNLNGAITTSGTQTYTGTATLAGNTSLTGTGLTYSRITGAGQDLMLDFTNAVDVGSAISGVRNLNIAKQSNLNGAITTTGTQTYAGTATLAGNTNLTGTGLTYSGITGNGKDLTLDFTNAVDIGNTISGVHDLNIAKQSNLNGAITTTGTQTYTGTSTLVGNTSLTGTSLTYSGITGSGKDLALDFTNAVDVGSAISGVRNLNMTKQSNLNGAITTTGTQTYTGTSTLLGNTVLTGTGLTYSGITGSGKDLSLDFTNAVDIGSGIAGVQNLIVNKDAILSGIIATGGTQTYTGTATLAGNTALTGTGLTYSGITGNGKDLALDFTNAVDIGSAISGVRDLSIAKQFNLNGAITTTGTQTYTGTATLSDNATLTGTDLTYSGIIGSGKDLALDFTNAVDIGSAISGVRDLSIAKQSNLNGAITTTGTQTYTGTATLAGNTALTGTSLTYSGITGTGQDLALDFTNAVNVGSAISGVRDLNIAKQSNLNGAITTTGTQTYTGTATLLSDTTLTGTGLTYSGITGSGKDLVLDFTNAVDVGSVISGVHNLSIAKQSNLNGAITTSGMQTYTGTATLAGNTSLTGTGLTYSGITGSGKDLTLDFTNAADIGSAIGGVHNLNITNQSNLNGVITTTGTQTYSGAATLVGNTALTGAGLTYNRIAGGGKNLTLNFDTPLGLIGEKVTGVQDFRSQQAVNVEGAFTTTGTQTYEAGLTLSNDVTLKGTGLTTTGILGSGKNLTLDFSAPFGLIGEKVTSVQDFKSKQAVNVEGAFTTTGSQTYENDLTLAGATQLTGASLNLNSNILGAANNLTLDFEDPLTLDGGQLQGLKDFATGTRGSTKLTGTLTTTGTQIYKNQVTLGDPTVLTGTALDFQDATSLTDHASLTGNTVTFGSTVNGGYNLDITGNAIFKGEVGGLDPLASLRVTGPTDLWSHMTTTGEQTYTGAATLNNTVGLTGSKVTFGNTLNGAHGLTVTGNTVFQNAVGTSAPLTSLAVNGATDIGTGTTPGHIKTTGNQSYGDVHLNNATTLTGDAGLTSTSMNGVGGAQNLTLDFLNPLTLAGNQFSDIHNFEIGTRGSTTLSGGLTTTGTQTYGNPVTLSSSTSQLLGTAITFNNTLNSLGDLVVGSADKPVEHATFNGAVGALATPLSSLTVYGPTTFNGAVGTLTAPLSSLIVYGPTTIGSDIFTSGAQTYKEATTLKSGAHELTSVGATRGAITFEKTLDGPGGLSIGNESQQDQQAIFNEVVGGTEPLAYLTVYGTSDVYNDIQTVGGQTYTDTMTLHAPNTELTSGGALSLDTITGPNTSLAIHSGSDVTFNGQSSSLNSLDVYSEGITHLNAPSSEISPTMTTLNGDQNFFGHVLLGADTWLQALTVNFYNDLSGKGVLQNYGLTVLGNSSFTSTHDLAYLNLGLLGAEPGSEKDMNTRGAIEKSFPPRDDSTESSNERKLAGTRTALSQKACKGLAALSWKCLKMSFAQP